MLEQVVRAGSADRAANLFGAWNGAKVQRRAVAGTLKHAPDIRYHLGRLGAICLGVNLSTMIWCTLIRLPRARVFA